MMYYGSINAKTIEVWRHRHKICCKPRLPSNYKAVRAAHNVKHFTHQQAKECKTMRPSVPAIVKTPNAARLYRLTWRSTGTQEIVNWQAVCAAAGWSVPTLRVKLSQGKGTAERTKTNPETEELDVLTIEDLGRQARQAASASREIITIKRTTRAEFIFHVTYYDEENVEQSRETIIGYTAIAKKLRLTESTLRQYLTNGGGEYWRNRPRLRVLIERPPHKYVTETLQLKQPGRPRKEYLEQP